MSAHLLDCLIPVSSGDSACPCLGELGWSGNGTQEALGWATLTAMLTHLLTHKASNVILLGAQDRKGSRSTHGSREKQKAYDAGIVEGQH